MLANCRFVMSVSPCDCPLAEPPTANPSRPWRDWVIGMKIVSSNESAGPKLRQIIYIFTSDTRAVFLTCTALAKTEGVLDSYL